jgi:hypothetical protein
VDPEKKITLFTWEHPDHPYNDPVLKAIREAGYDRWHRYTYSKYVYDDLPQKGYLDGIYIVDLEEEKLEDCDMEEIYIRDRSNWAGFGFMTREEYDTVKKRTKKLWEILEKKHNFINKVSK